MSSAFALKKIPTRLLNKPQVRKVVKNHIRKLCKSNIVFSCKPIFEKILIANRGEIACRIIKTAKKMGIKTVAVFSVADSSSKHVKLADEAIYIGPPTAAESYLNTEKIMNAIKLSGSEAVHPGYGFLSENAKFVEMLETENVIFIGPSAEVIKSMGDKLESKRLAIAAGINTIPGYDGIIVNEKHCVEISNDIGYPVMIKASAGGGGKGMRIAYNDNEAREGFQISSQEALSSFGDGRILVEKFIKNPRHIEIQILADKHRNVIYLHERECSIQRRNQKIIEEAPSTFLDAVTRKKMGAQAVNLCKTLGYSSAGTVEFLVDENQNFYFLEMNTRLQVEHPVTECITGIDIVEQMILISTGHKLKLLQEDVRINGWAIETRIYAEDPYKNFGWPNTGRLYKYIEPKHLLGVRCDSGIEEGSEISIYYDAMISKLICHGKNRTEAIERTISALDNYVIRGVKHNIPLLRDVITQKKFSLGNITTNYLADVYETGFQNRRLSSEEKNKLFAVSAILYVIKDQKSREYFNGPKILIHAKNLETWKLVVNIDNEIENVCVKQTNGYFNVKIGKLHFVITKKLNLVNPILSTEINGEPFLIQLLSTHSKRYYEIMCQGKIYTINILTTLASDLLTLLPNKSKNSTLKLKKIKAPMSGLIKLVSCHEGDFITEGDQLCTIEAMKMQNSVTATSSGKIATIKIKEGDTISEGDLLIQLE